MAVLPSLPPEARRILDLARDDSAAAREAFAKLSLEAQVDLVCASPVSQRGRLLDLAAEPEKLVPALPEAELCYTAKAIGLPDAGWLLAHASPEQVVACVDLDAWRNDLPDRPAFGAWLRALVEAGDEPLLAAANALDPELLTLFLLDRIAVELKPSEEGWEPPPGARSLDGQFWYTARREKDDLSDIEALLRVLFENRYWSYYRLLQGTIWEGSAELEKWTLRWREGRLLDLGFPPWEEAMAIYARLPAESLASLPESDASVSADPGEWAVPIHVSGLPALAGDEPSLFRAIAGLSDDERPARLREFVALANKVAVANHLTLGDAESLPSAFERAARTASRGLDFVAAENGVEPTQVLRRLPLERLFRVGANLSGELPELREPDEGPGDTD